MYKVIGAILLAMMFMGAGCDNRKQVVVNQKAYGNPEPAKPAEPDYEPAQLDQDEVPTAGIGSIKSDMDCNGGTITTNYSFGNVSDDSRSFVMQYERNGVLEDLTYPSTSTTGSRTTVKDIYYARQNDDKRDAMWIVTISYQGANETYNLVTTTLRQPKCDDNTTSISSVLEFK